MKFDAEKIVVQFPGKVAWPLRQLIEFINADAWDDLRQVAYVLATTQHEVGGTYLPITERGAKSYFNKYEPGTLIGKRLGNIEAGDGYRYRGRGYCQITGRGNYLRFGDLLEIELIAQPHLALEPAIAYSVMSLGMTQGLFTGRHLNRYINHRICDYVGARRVVNGVDRAELIASYALAWEERLRVAEMRMFLGEGE